jgi:hypothetical protein
MTETLEELRAQLAKLNAARASGTSSMSYVANGVSRTVTYKSDIEMRGAQMDLMQRIAAFGEFPRTVRVQSSKGLGDRRWRPNEPPR